MSTVVTIIVRVVLTAIYALQLMMLARAIISWIAFDEDSPLQHFLYCATEPFILPIRKLIERSSRLSALPIDISFLAAYILLSVIAMLLPAVHF